MNVLLVGLNLDGAMGNNFSFMVSNLTRNYKYKWYILRRKSKLEISLKNVIKSLEVSYNIKNPILLLRECILIRRFIKENSIDKILIFTPNLVYNVYISIFFNKIEKIYYLHDPKPHSGEGIVRNSLLNIQNYIVSNRAKKVIVASEFIRNEIIKNNRLFIKKEKIEVIYLGLLENLVFPEFIGIDLEYDVLFFGRIEEYKGLDVLVKALKILKQRGIKLRCKVIGKGELEKFVEKEDLYLFELNNRYIEDYELAKEIAKSKFIIFPYKNATGTQTVQVAYYYNKVVIASDVGCFNDYVKDEKTGYIFKSGDYNKVSEIIEKNIYDEEKYLRMSKNTKYILEEKFLTNKIMQKYYTILE